MKHFFNAFTRTRLAFLIFFFCSQQCIAGRTGSGTSFADASVGDLVWLDRNMNGLQDAGESGFPGMEVLLLDDGGRQIASTFTDAHGNYSFTGLSTGVAGKWYELLFMLPDNFRFCRRNGTIADTQNSDANETTGRSGLLLLLPGENNTSVDAGLINSSLGTLPLHTLDLSAELKGGKVNLKWLAENEMNTERFIVQQSTDGIHFSTVHISAVNGIINIPTYYYHTADVSMVNAAVLYFRIKAEDDANRSAYSNITIIRLDVSAEVRLWPNPFIQEVHLSYFSVVSSSLTLQLTDAAGQSLWQGRSEINRGNNQLTVGNLSRLSKGIYYLTITDNNTGYSVKRKIIK